MANGLNFVSLQAALAVQVPTFVSDPNFSIILPLSIDYAEQRIYRDFDFLINYGINAATHISVGNNISTLPNNVVDIPSIYYGPNNIPVPFASLDYINMVYGTAAVGPPEYVAFMGSNTGTPGYQLYFGPSPDQSYTISYYGSIFPAVLSASNLTTWLSLNMPDIFFAANMVFISGYLKNYGAAGTVDDPGMGQNWEKQYEFLMDSVNKEEMRRQFKSMPVGAPK